MCEKSRCAHGAEALCSCKPVEDREKDILALVEHVAVNMADVRWELDYTDLNLPEKRRLCRVGVCRVCGGRLCHEMDASDDLAGDDFLAAVYRHLLTLDADAWRLRSFAAGLWRCFTIRTGPLSASGWSGRRVCKQKAAWCDKHCKSRFFRRNANMQKDIESVKAEIMKQVESAKAAGRDHVNVKVSSDFRFDLLMELTLDAMRREPSLEIRTPICGSHGVLTEAIRRRY